MSYLGFQNVLIENSQFLRPSAIKLTQSSVLANDLIQETIYKALKYSDKFQEGTNIKSWLYTIMRNIFINEYRKKKQQNTIQDDSDNQYILNSLSLSSNNLAESYLMKKELKKVFDEIPHSVTKPFLMHHSGYKYDEIAEILDIPIGTVKSKIFFAKKALKEELMKIGINSSKS